MGHLAWPFTAAGRVVFAGETSVSQIRRSFAELAAFLFRSSCFLTAQYY